MEEGNIQESVTTDQQPEIIRQPIVLNTTSEVNDATQSAPVVTKYLFRKSVERINAQVKFP